MAEVILDGLPGNQEVLLPLDPDAPPQFLREKGPEIHEGWTDEDGSRGYTVPYVITTNDRRIGAMDVLARPDCPKEGDTYKDERGTEDTGSRCCHRRAARDVASPYNWTVFADYKSRSRLTGQEKQNPIARPAIFSFRTEKVNKAAQAAIDQTDPLFPLTQPVINSAGQPFNPPVEVFEYLEVIVVRRNQANYDRRALRKFRGTVNASPWNDYAEWEVLCDDITAEQQTEDGTDFFLVTFTFKAKAEGTWVRPILDQGTHELRVGATEISPIFRSGSSVPTMSPLNGLGRAAPLGSAVFLPFLFNKPKDFGPLGITFPA